MDHDWIRITSFDTLPAAEVARVALEDAGIPTQFENAELVAMAWHLGNAVGYVKLFVPRRRVQHALDVLREDREKAEETRCRA